MNRLKIIFNLLLGKEIVIYNTWTKKIVMIIGGNDEILTKRYDYDFIYSDDKHIYGNNESGEIFFKNENKM